MRARVVAALLGTTLLLAGCSAGVDDGPDPQRGAAVAAPGDPKIDVDTPELQAAKAAAGIEDCAPGDASGDGGLPPVVLPCLGGGPDVDMSSLRGPLVINFWYAACGPCRKEMPILGDFHRQHGAQVPVLGVDLQDTVPGLAIELAGERRATYPQVADTGGELLTYPELAQIGTRGLPFTAVVDADGEIRGRFSGGFDDVAELATLVDQSLGTDLAGDTAGGSTGG